MAEYDGGGEYFPPGTDPEESDEFGTSDPDTGEALDEYSTPVDNGDDDGRIWYPDWDPCSDFGSTAWCGYYAKKYGRSVLAEHMTLDQLNCCSEAWGDVVDDLEAIDPTKRPEVKSTVDKLLTFAGFALAIGIVGKVAKVW